MNRLTLKALMRARAISQSELARRVSVSRQAVSLWLKQPGDKLSVTADNLVAVARTLGCPVEQLVAPLPLRDPRERKMLEARLLWDRLYPSLEELAIAVAREEPRAIARLVEVYGLYTSASLAGSSAVWRDFMRYRRFIPPVRRRQLEHLHRWKTTRAKARRARRRDDGKPALQ